MPDDWMTDSLVPISMTPEEWAVVCACLLTWPDATAQRLVIHIMATMEAVLDCG